MTEMSYEDRFWARVEKHGPDECWWWLGEYHKDTHGHATYQGRLVGAHRIAYMLAVGPIPHNLIICHRCNNAGCVNPAHLYAGNGSDNMNDVQAARRARGGITLREFRRREQAAKNNSG